ncbi:DDE-type integrase/transposase/recombinase [Teredinibacter haidensis]|uniref:DDE-type integrase/transposase/recombinase n=1 Tax=Teredinibacter haidensis TaxID=2731755 RepID=UPI003CCE0823
MIGWTLDTQMTEELITRAKQMAIDARGVAPGLIVQSYRGTQYRSNSYVSFLEKHGIRRSMSRKGNCWKMR